ncbi:MAG: DUF2442 domain-containing protein [Chloroflexota bacterium]
MSMFPRIVNVQPLHDFVLEMTFADGKTAELDFRDQIVGRGGVFAALEDVALFQQVQVDEEAGTLVWPNGVDFCPDVLYSEATNTPLPV